MTSYDEQSERYLILFEGGPPSNYSAWSPDLPGCVATGASLAAVEQEMRAAIVLHLEGMTEDGDTAPKPSAARRLRGARPAGGRVAGVGHRSGLDSPHV